MTSGLPALYSFDSALGTRENAGCIWQTVLDHLHKHITKALFDCCLRDTRALALENDVLTIGVDTPYARERIRQNLMDSIRREILDLLERPVEVRLVLTDDERAGELRGSISSRGISFQERSPTEKGTNRPTCMPV